MSKQLNIHLFNCDRTYKLNVVEDWLKAVADSSKVVSHYFSLSEMTQLSDKTIPELEMDVAVFVVHAHESRLSINEENAGIGYAKLYKALLEKTGREVLIVIGGDDNYRNQDEEDREFISQWAKRKVSSQFAMDFLDGSRSFIFSWDKKHREIHEKALKHFFDPTKKGKKFEYHPPQRKAVTKNQGAGPQRAKGSAMAPDPFTWKQDKFPSMEGTQAPTYRGRGQELNIGGTAMAPDPFISTQDKFPSVGGTQAPTYRGRDQEFDTGGIGRHGIQKQGARLKENALSTTGIQEGSVVIGCSVSERSIHAVLQEIASICPTLNITAEPLVENLSPTKAKQYLERHSLQLCVLVVDAETIKDAYENLPERRDDYKVLLKTAVERVANKVILLVCDDVCLPEKDAQIIHQEISLALEEKGLVAWLKKGSLIVPTDVSAQGLNTALTMMQQNIVQKQTNVPSSSVDKKSHLFQPSERQFGYGLGNANMHQQQEFVSPVTPSYTEHQLTGELLLKGKLRYGIISSEQADEAFLSPKYKGLSEDSFRKLWEKFQFVEEIEVKVLSVTGDNQLVIYVGDQGIEMADNDLLVLSTRVNKGLVSFHEDDLRFRYPNWRVPDHILEDLKSQRSNGKLFLIFNERGILRCKVKSGKMDRAISFKDKASAFLSGSFS